MADDSAALLFVLLGSAASGNLNTEAAVIASDLTVSGASLPDLNQNCEFQVLEEKSMRSRKYF
jgi:hypothetical protein